MEFSEKLQLLRKKHNLTQEQLAEQLFVSRTAVSKWESGRGYPNLDSLKCISRIFSISIDELLSNDELIELAETESRTNVKRVSGVVLGALDAITAALLFLPLFGRQEGEYVQAVTLLNYTEIADFLRMLFFALPTIISLHGVFGIVIGVIGSEERLRSYKLCSVVLCAAAILLFALSRQPYMTAILFLLFMVKIILIIMENRIR